MVGRLCHSQVANMLWQLGSHQEGSSFTYNPDRLTKASSLSSLSVGEKLFPSLSMLGRFHHGELGGDRLWRCWEDFGAEAALHCAIPASHHWAQISALRQQERAAACPGCPAVSSKVATDSFCPWGRAGSAQAGAGMEQGHLLKQNPSKLQVFTTNQL